MGLLFFLQPFNVFFLIFKIHLSHFVSSSTVFFSFFFFLHKIPPRLGVNSRQSQQHNYTFINSLNLPFICFFFYFFTHHFLQIATYCLLKILLFYNKTLLGHFLFIFSEISALLNLPTSIKSNNIR